MTETDLAWAAGFLDGEGCVQVAKAGRASAVHVLRVSAPQVSRPPLDRLARLFGGNIYRRAMGRRDMRPQWVWEVTSKRAASALRLLLPYLIVKRAEAEIAVLFQASKTTRQGRRRTPFEEAEQASFREALIEAHHFEEGGDVE